MISLSRNNGHCLMSLFPCYSCRKMCVLPIGILLKRDYYLMNAFWTHQERFLLSVKFGTHQSFNVSNLFAICTRCVFSVCHHCVLRTVGCDGAFARTAFAHGCVLHFDASNCILSPQLTNSVDDGRAVKTFVLSYR